MDRVINNPDIMIIPEHVARDKALIGKMIDMDPGIMVISNYGSLYYESPELQYFNDKLAETGIDLYSTRKNGSVEFRIGALKIDVKTMISNQNPANN